MGNRRGGGLSEDEWGELAMRAWCADQGRIYSEGRDVAAWAALGAQDRLRWEKIAREVVVAVLTIRLRRREGVAQ